MSEQVVFVSGAGSGIGREVARAVARRGGSIAGTYWGPENERDDFIRELRELGGRALLKDVDVRRAPDYHELARAARKTFGEFDLWVNCAARLLVKPFLETDDGDWNDLIDSNLLGYVRGCRYASEVLRRGGSIVNVSSITAQQTPDGLSAYVSVKGAIDALTRALAVELAPDIRVNAVAPGAIDTALNLKSWTPEVRNAYIERSALKRLGSAAEIADTILAVASDSMSFVTGQVIVADGGLLVNGSVGHEAS